MMGARVVATDASSTSLGLIRSNAETYQDACAYPITAVPLLWGDQQSLAITLEQMGGAEDLPAQAALMERLEARGLLDRDVGALPDAAAMQRMFDGFPKAPRKLAGPLWQALNTALADEDDAPLARADERDRKVYKRLQQGVAERSAALGLPDGVLASRRWIEALQDGEDWPGPLSGWRRAQLAPVLAPVLATIGKH